MIADNTKMPKIEYYEILPKNKNTEKLEKKRKEEEEAKKAREDAQRIQKEKDANEKKRKQREDRQQLEQQKKHDAEQRMKQQAEEEAAGKLTGRLLFFLQRSSVDQTPREYSTAGLELGNARIGILTKTMAFNNSLTQLCLSRKNIEDSSGVEIARILYTNTALRKLELEFNRLGPLTAREFGIALTKNFTLRYLNLESNVLTMEGEDPAGVQKHLIPALRQNRFLLSLNLGNNKLENAIGKDCDDMLDENYTLIDFEFANNGFLLPPVRSIQEKLLRNNKFYQEDRLREWKERKHMLQEDHALTAMYLDQTTKAEQRRMEEENKEQRQREIDAMWKKYTEENIEEKKQILLQLQEAAEIRASRGKRRGKKRGGKKKGKK